MKYRTKYSQILLFEKQLNKKTVYQIICKFYKVK